MIASRAISSVDAALKMVTLLPELRLFTISCYPSHRVQRSFVWINELLISSLTLKNFYTCRSARSISPMGSLWIYSKSNVNDFSLLIFVVRHFENQKPQAISSLAHGTSPEGRPRHEVPSKKKNKGGNLYHVTYTVSRSCEPSVSWFAVYRMCNETVARSK